MLSFVAGMVNVSGLFALRILTTNVTGHFAYFAEEITFENFKKASVYLLYVLSFLAGAFLCNFLIQWIYRINEKIIFMIPMLVEVLLLLAVGFFVNESNAIEMRDVTACVLLLAMGLQNALVTQVSRSVVRTTHLTGLFTDLGIDLSQWIWDAKNSDRKRINKSILLKLTIICCFFFGGMVSGFFFGSLHFKTLFIAAAVLLLALYYDYILFQYYLLRRLFYRGRIKK